jgi:IS30 family transposase
MPEGNGPTLRLSSADRRELQVRVRAGESHAAAAAAVGCSAKSVQRLLRQTGGVKPAAPFQSALRLSLREREEVSRGLRSGDSCRVIAQRLGRAPSTITREVAANGRRTQYRAWSAQETAAKRRRRPKPTKLATCLPLRQAVEQGLHHRWSPQQIAASLIKAYPERLEMRISHETIYQSLFVQARGGVRPALVHALRSGRTQRRAHGRVPGSGRLKHMVLISERPATVEDRAVPGHWEGDLVFGKLGQSAIATLVERHSRYTVLVHLPAGRRAEHVKDALIQAVRRLPVSLRGTLTWDQGKEMEEHVRFTVATGVQIYFCDPHSPWQRGTNENTNGLLRQYLPRGTDLSSYTQRQLNHIAAELNTRPRRTLAWETPADVFARAVAMTD